MRTMFLVFFALSYMVLGLGIMVMYSAYTDLRGFNVAMSHFNWNLMGWATGVGCISALMLAFHFSTYFRDNMWKAQKELDLEKDAVRKNRLHLDKLLRVIGEHEGIKLWEAEKAKNEEKS